jgi:prevent-host-death family protein
VSSVVSATEARIHFGELLRRVAQSRETIFVERGGRPQVVVLAVPEYERLISAGQAGGWRERAQEARDRIRAEVDIRDLPPVEDGILQGREERDEQLDRMR